MTKRALFGEIGALECLSRYWPPYAAFVNGPQPDAALRGDWVAHRRALEAVLCGRWLLRGHGVDVPLLLVGDASGVRWAVDGPKLGARAKADFRFTLMLLGLPDARQLLRRCDYCGEYFLGARRARRKRNFCSDSCRSASRERQDAAAYMRGYRRLQAKRRREQQRARQGR